METSSDDELRSAEEKFDEFVRALGRLLYARMAKEARERARSEVSQDLKREPDEGEE